MRVYFLLLFFIAPAAFSQKQGNALIDSFQVELSKHGQKPSSDRAYLLNSIGKAYLNISDYTHAMASFHECLDIAEKLKIEELIAPSYRNFALVYHAQANYARAEENGIKALELYEKSNNREMQGIVIKNLADSYQQTGDSAKSASFYLRALQLFKELNNNPGQASVYSNLSLLSKTNYEQKIGMALQAKRIWDKEDPGNQLPIANIGNIGVAYLDVARYDTLNLVKPSALIPAGKKARLKLAEMYIRMAIDSSKKKNDVDYQAYFTGVLAELQHEQGDYKNAYLNFRIYQANFDSIYSQENKNRIAEVENQRAISQKNKEIETKELEISNQQKKMWLLIIGLGFLALFGLLLVRQNRLRKKTNTALFELNAQLSDANKVKAKFFGILSHDLRSPVANLVNFLQLQKRNPGMLSEQQLLDREKKIADAATSLLDNMEGMLLWSKGQMENFQPQVKLIAVQSLFTHIERFFSSTENVHFRFTAVPGLQVTTDENYLQTIMHNLTANSIKALQDTEDAMIEWRAWQQNGKLFLSITDNGPGAEPEQLKALYDETSVSGVRHGMGLHIIRDLAKAIGCSITSDSKPGGASFVLVL